MITWLLKICYSKASAVSENDTTELATLELTDRIRRKMDQNEIPFSVFLDLSKAFDL